MLWHYQEKWKSNKQKFREPRGINDGQGIYEFDILNLEKLENKSDNSDNSDEKNENFNVDKYVLMLLYPDIKITNQELIVGSSEWYCYPSSVFFHIPILIMFAIHFSFVISDNNKLTLYYFALHLLIYINFWVTFWDLFVNQCLDCRYLRNRKKGVRKVSNLLFVGCFVLFFFCVLYSFLCVPVLIETHGICFFSKILIAILRECKKQPLCCTFQCLTNSVCVRIYAYKKNNTNPFLE